MIFAFFLAPRPPPSSVMAKPNKMSVTVLLALVCEFLSAAFCVPLKLYHSASEIVLQADNTLTYMILIIL